MSSLDRKAVRVAISDTSPATLLDVLTTLLDACAEHARALKMQPAEFAEHALEAYAESHDQTVTEFEYEEDELGDHSVVVVFSEKWRKN